MFSRSGIFRFGPTSRHFRIPYVQQIATNDCGAACLAMTLRHHGIACDPFALYRRLQPQARGVSASAILAVAREYGLEGRGIQVPATFLRRLATGSILYWRSNHFVVLDSADDSGIQIVDPASGRTRLRWRSVKRPFGGVVLEFEPVDSSGAQGVSSSSS